MFYADRDAAFVAAKNFEAGVAELGGWFGDAGPRYMIGEVAELVDAIVVVAIADIEDPGCQPTDSIGFLADGPLHRINGVSFRQYTPVKPPPRAQVSYAVMVA